jgi:hypothetical protein
MGIGCRFGASRQEVVVKGRSARPHFPNLVTIANDFLLDNLLLVDNFLSSDLGDVGLDLTDLDLTRKIGLELLDNLLENLITLVTDLVSDVEIVGVWTAGTKTVFAVVEAGLFED